MMFNYLQKVWVLRVWRDTAGQDMVEYALLAGFITVAVAATFPPVINELSVIFSKLGSATANAAA